MIQVNRKGAILDIALSLERNGQLEAGDVATLSTALNDAERRADIYGIVLRVSARAGPGAGTARVDPVAIIALHGLAWQTDRFPKPIVSYLCGEVSPELSAIAWYGTHRVAGVDYRFRARNADDLSLPPIGSAHRLAALPEGMGETLAATGDVIGAEEALSLGILTHGLDEIAFEAAVAGLANADPVDPLLDSRSTLVASRSFLQTVTKHADATRAAAAEMNVAAIARGRRLELRECILADCAVALRLAATEQADIPGMMEVVRADDRLLVAEATTAGLILPTSLELEPYKH